MTKKIIACVLFFLLNSNVYAGPKEDFVAAVKAQCSKSDSEALSLATPGRSGTVFKFKLCTNPKVDVGKGCVISCSKAGAKIGS